MEFFLRKSKDEDISDIYNLVNRKYIEKYSKRNMIEEWEIHRDWYRFLIKSPKHFLYTVCDINGSFLGHVRFEIIGEIGLIFLALSEDIRGNGLSKRVIKESMIKISMDAPGVKTVEADILEENYASRKAFKSLDFVESGKSKEGVVRYLKNIEDL
jgi:RimJ/RimL family protein N-acetyltransferase